MYTFVLNKSFVQLLDISPKTFMFSKTVNLQFSYIELWFTDENSKPLEIEDTDKNFWIMLNNLQQMELKLLQKE